MSDFQLPPESDDDSEAIRNMRAHIKALEADVATKTQNLADNADLAKENAFLKAGIDVKDPVAVLLLNSYDGELDEQAIQAAAAAVRLTPGESAPVVEPEVDASQTQERNALANDGGGAAQLPPEDPIKAGYAQFYDELSRGSSREDASAAVIGKIITAANSGDERFRFDPQQWTSQAEAAQR